MTDPSARTRPAWADPDPSATPDRIFVGLLLLAAALRFLDLTTNEVWVDEANSVLTAQHSVPAILEMLSRDSSPPLYYLLLHGWIGIFGDGAAALRIPSALFSLVLMIAVYVVGAREFSRGVGRWAAFLFAIAPAQIFHSQQIRMYTLLALLAFAAWWFLVRYLRDGRPRDYGFALAATAAALYTHNFAVYVPAVHVVLVLASGQLFRRWRMWALAFVVLALAYAPWIPTLLLQLDNSDHYAWYLGRWQSEGWSGAAFRTLRSFSPAGSVIAYARTERIEWYGVPAVVGGAFALAGAVSLWRRRRTLRKPVVAWIFAALCVPVLAALLVSSFVTPHYVPGRVDQMVFPYFALLMALGAASVRPPVLQALLVPVFLAVALVGRGALYADYADLSLKGGMRELTDAIVEELEPDDVIVCTSLTRAPLEYYLQRAGAQAPIFSFPRDTARHLGSQNHARLARDRSALVAEAGAVIAAARAEAGPGGRLFLLRTNVDINDALGPKSRARRFGVQLTDRLGRFNLSGTKEQVWLSVNRFGEASAASNGAAH